MSDYQYHCKVRIIETFNIQFFSYIRSRSCTMIKKIVYIIFFTTITTVSAQNEVDVLRLSTTDVYGSARFESMAGSFGALGADFSAIQINPAGLGRFSSSQFAFSLSNSFISTQGNFSDAEVRETNANTKVGTLGAVFTKDKSHQNEGRIYRQLTLGYTRLKNFDYVKRYEGQNFNSLLDVFANMGEGIPEGIENETFQIYNERPFSTGLGLDVDAINYHPSSVSYYPELPPTSDVYHNRTIETSGGIGEFHFGLSENYMNTLYYGGSIGLRRVKYTQNIYHKEDVVSPEPEWTLHSFEYFDNLEIKGWGFNFKAGLLYLPSEEVRVGLAFETPTYYNLEDNFSSQMTAYHTYGTMSTPSGFIPHGEFSYRLRTPARLRGSLAYILDRKGAINIDVEFVDYRRGRLSNQLSTTSFAYNFNFENSEVVNQHRAVLNTRIGFEHLISPEVFFRAGYALIPQAFKRDLGNMMRPNQTFAIGFGYDGDKIALDIGYRIMTLSEDYFAFDPSQESNRAMFKSLIHALSFSISTRF